MAFTLGPQAISAGYRLASFDQIGSTNSEAMARARAGERGPIWFVTTEQTAGRGRRHRPWIAPRGNLASSVLETIDVAPAIAATLGFAAGLALAGALRAVAGSASVRFSLKWPNDVLAGRRSSPASCWRRRRCRAGGLPWWSAWAPISLPRRRARRRLLRRFGRWALRSPPSSSLRPCRTAGPNAAASGIRGRGFGEIRRRWLALAAGTRTACRGPHRPGHGVGHFRHHR